MIDALLAAGLAARRELPVLVRGFLIACSCGSLQLCVMGQSRGWLFTLPFVLLCSIAVVKDRLRIAAVAMLPAVAAAAPARQLVNIFRGNEESNAALAHAARSAAQTSLLLCAGMMAIGALLAWTETRTRVPTLSPVTRRRLGAVVVTVTVAFACIGALAATHGQPVAFIKRQLNGFSHEATGNSGGSHFEEVGSGRYDFWRVSLDALAAHPIGGLGQDNFADYYVTRRRTYEDPRWPHSLEMRLLAMTGLVGFLLFSTFVVAGILAALRTRRTATPERAFAGLALLPLVVWLIHGSIDWLWEVPALSGPALGFLGMACALQPAAARIDTSRRSWRAPSWLVGATGAVGLIACTAVLALPYLSVRMISQATDVADRSPAAALSDLATAADLNPWNPDPVRLAGTIALQTGRFVDAQRLFRQTIAREPEGWFAWLGVGLAASALGERDRARMAFKTAAAINSLEPTIRAALDRVLSPHPMTASAAFAMLASESGELT